MSDSKSIDRIETIFQAALDFSSHAEREAFVKKECGDDTTLLSFVQRLLQAHENAAAKRTSEDYLERPAPGATIARDLRQEPLDAGLAATFQADEAAVVGSQGHSVLQALTRSMSKVPQVTLPEGREEEGQVEMPGSSQIPPGSKDGRYQFFGEIARGGMGAILRGRDNDLGRDLAVKVLLESHQKRPDMAERFVEEAQIGGQLQHPGIAPVYELGQLQDERPFFTMKLVKGETLAAILSKRNDAGEDHPKLLGIFEQICQTMAYAHSKGVIHRDLKPANVMVGAFGEVQVMDWGLSKVLSIGGAADEAKSLDRHREVSVVETRRSAGSDLPGSSGSDTRYGTAMGTPAYMPPEQALGEVDRLDTRADVFGLGAILAEILTGKPPYVGDSQDELLRLARRGSLNACFSRLEAADIEEELRQITKAALAVEPDDRLQDAAILSAQVTSYLEGVQERLKSAELHRAKAETRRKMSLAIAGTLLLAIVCGFIAYSQRVRFAMQREVAELERDRAHVAEVLAQTRALDENNGAIAMQLLLNESDSLPKGDLVSKRSLQSELLRRVHDFGGRQLDDGVTGWVSSMDQDGRKVSTDVIMELAFSPDSRWLVAGNLIWDMTAKDPESTMHRLHEDNVWGIAFDPSSRWLVTRSNAGRFQVIDLANNFQVRQLQDDGGSWKGLVFSPDGKWLATSEFQSTTIRLYGWEEDGPTGRVEEIKAPAVSRAIKISPNGDWLAAHTDNSLSLWKMGADLSDEPAKVLPIQCDQFNLDFQFDPAGRWLAATCRDDTVKLWDLGEEPEAGPREFHDVGAQIHRVRFTENSEMIGLSSLGPIIWDLSNDDTNNPVRRLATLDRVVDPNTVLVDDRWLVCPGGIIDMEEPNADKQSLELKMGHVWTLAVSSDAKWLATGAETHKFPRIYRLDNMAHVRSPHVIHGGNRASYNADGTELTVYQRRQPSLRQFNLTSFDDHVRPVEVKLSGPTIESYLSRNGSWFMAGDEQGNAHIRNLADIDAPERTFVADESGGAVRQYAISNDGRYVVTNIGTSQFQLWRLQPDQPEAPPERLGAPYSVETEFRPNFEPFVFSGDDRWLFIGRNGKDGTLCFRVGEGELTHVGTIPWAKGTVHRPSMSRGGRWMCTRGRGGGTTDLWLWDLHSKNPLAAPIRLPGHRDINFPNGGGIGFSNDETHLVTGDWTTRALVWRLDNLGNSREAAPIHQMDGNLGSVYATAISADHRLVACSGHQHLTIWDISGEEPEIYLRLTDTDGIINSLEFHPDPSRRELVSAGSGNVHLWNLDFDSTVEDAIEIAGFVVSDEELASWGF